ncbi:MAG: elongation factor P--(R)-beta-lysine ligase [Sulfuriflexus sp.]|nr:elongation factor P--(R)-beta-lysine ligase [Sulfuriflexus sp.]
MTDRLQHWRPTASLDVLKKRAELLRQIRAFFYARDVLEVDTPALSVAGNTDPNIESFRTDYTGPGNTNTLYLHTSPEFSMKRLLAADSGAIYQLCKVFRNGEAGRQHNPEFTMLEWYRPDFDHHQLMNEVAELINDVLGKKEVLKISYQQAFIEHAGIDPLDTNQNALKKCAQQNGLEKVIGMDEASVDDWLDLLIDQVVVPKLGRGRVFIYDYPASQAALAEISESDSRVAERFELFIDGVEIANGFHELTDVVEQRQRFESENKKREEVGLSKLPIDENLLAALEEGLPDCAGVAIGIDRLLMIVAGVDSISDVVTISSIE